MPFRIKTKLMVAFLAMLIPFAAISALDYLAQRAFHRNTAYIEHMAGEIALLSEISLGIDRLLMPANDYLITGDPEERVEFRRIADEIDKRIEALDAYPAMSGHGAEGFFFRLLGFSPAKTAHDEEGFLKELKEAFGTVREKGERILSIESPVGFTGGGSLMKDMDLSGHRLISGPIYMHTEAHRADLSAAVKASGVLWQRSSSMLAGSFVFLMAAAAFFALFYARLFVRPITVLRDGTGRLASGDLGFRISVKTGDEIEDLGRSINAMAERLGNFYSQLEYEVRERTSELRFEHDKLMNVFNAMEDGVYIVNRDYEIEYVNPALIREFGPAEGKKCYEYFHGRREVCPFCPNDRVFAGETVRWEWHSTKNDRTYDLVDTPVRNPDGTVSKLEIFRDITTNKIAEEALKESEERYRTMIETSNDLIWLVDAYGKVVFANRKCSEMSGYSMEDLIGKTSYDFVLEEDVPRIKESIQRAFNGVSDSYEARVKGRDGRLVYLSVNSAPFYKEGMIAGKIAFGRDITSMRTSEKAMRERIEELERYMKVSVQREFKIQELKEEIARLKGGGSGEGGDGLA